MFVTAYELVGYVMFLFVLSVTPGPNNLLVLQASAAGGIRKALPLMFGIALSVHAMLALAALGVIGAVSASQVVQDLARLCAGLVLAYLSVRTVLAAGGTSAPASGAAGFFGGAAFQLVNPKAWVVVFALAAMFASSGDGGLRAAILFLIGVPVSLISLTIWASAGAFAHRLLAQGRARMAINYALAAVLTAMAGWFVINGAAGLASAILTGE